MNADRNSGLAMFENFSKSYYKYTDGLSYAERDGLDMPIIFLHGSGFSKEVFVKQFKSEILKEHRLIAVDFPGHGQSADAVDPKKTYSYSGLANRIRGFIDRLQINDCIVMGWSLGGQAALELIDEAPQVSGIMTCGAAPATNGPLGLMHSMYFSKMLLLAGKAKFTKQDAEYFEKACFGDLTDCEFTEILKRTDKNMRSNISKSVLRSFGTSQATRLKNSTKPVCLLHGRNDGFIKNAYMENISNSMLYSGKTVFMENSGHAPFFDDSLRFDKVLKDFVEVVKDGSLELYSEERMVS